MLFARSIKPFERSRSAADAGLWELNDRRQRCGASPKLCGAAEKMTAGVG